MVLLLIVYLQEHFAVKVPAVFSYYSTRMLLAAATALLLSIFLGPRFIRKLYELKIGQPIRMEDCPLLGELHAQKKDTPTMGGVLILSSMLLSLFIWMDLSHSFTVMMLFVTLILGAVGAYDDFLKLKYSNSKGLSGKKKILIQFFCAAVLAAYLLIPETQVIFFPPVIKSPAGAALSVSAYASQLYLPFVKYPILTFSGLGLVVLAFFFIFVIIGSSNAVNLTDGLDGLAAGTVIMVAGCFALIAFISNNLYVASYLNMLYIEGSGELAIYMSIMIGSCLGFLWYNGHPAQVFMGDTGSLALGGILGVCAVLLRREFLLALVGGVFVLEALSVIIQVLSYRLRNKKRVFLCAPLHHHFEYKGWPETKVVLRFWIVGFLLAFIGLMSLKFQ